MSFYYDIYFIRPVISSVCFTLVHVLQTTCALAMWIRTVSHMMLKNVASTAVAHAI